MMKKFLLLSSFLFVVLGLNAQNKLKNLNTTNLWNQASQVDFGKPERSTPFSRNLKPSVSIKTNNSDRFSANYKNLATTRKWSDAANLDFGSPEKASKFSRDFVKKSNRSATQIDDWSFYYEENSWRMTSELNTFLGKTGNADGGFDSTLYFSIPFKKAAGGAVNYKYQIFQFIPLNASATLNKIALKGRSLKSGTDSSKVIALVYDKSFNMLTVDSFYMKTSTTLDDQMCVFNKPATSSDTIIVSFLLDNEADSFRLAHSHSRYNNFDFGTKAAPKVFKSALPFSGGGAVYAIDFDKDTMLGMVLNNFDMYMVPQISYEFKADFTATNGTNSSASDLTIPVGDSVKFKNNTHGFNPILNYIKWDELANNKSADAFYSKYIFGSNVGDTSLTKENPFSKKFAQVGTFPVKAFAYIYTWSQGFKRDSTIITVKVECNVTLSPSTFSLPSSAAANGTVVATVTASNCPWTAVSDQSWLTTTSSMDANGPVIVSAIENTSTNPRIATITVNGKTITVTQPGAIVSNCTYALNPTKFTCSDNTAKAYTGVSSVTTGSTCVWTATSNDSWITTSSSGTGGGSVSINVTENTTYVSRTGTIKIDNQTLTITQPGAIKPGIKIDDWSFYYEENSWRMTSELNTFLGKTGSADGGFDSTLYFSIPFKKAAGGAINYKYQIFQFIPLNASATLNKIALKGRSLKSGTDSSKVIALVYDKSFNMLTVDSFYMKTSTTLDDQMCVFNKPATSSDTIIVRFMLDNEADSFRLAHSHSRYNNFDFGTKAAPKVFKSALPFSGGAAVYAIDFDKDTMLGMVLNNFDMYMVPQISYEFKADFTATNGTNSSASDLTIPVGDSVKFKNNTHGFNPILNYIKWDELANNKGADAFYSKYIFGSNVGDTSLTKEDPFSKKFAQAGTFPVKAFAYLYTWSQGFKRDSTIINVIVECSVTLSASTFSLPSSAAANGTTIATVTASNCAWTAVSDQSWLTTTSSGSANGEVIINATENTSSSPRTATITVNGKTITVTQPGAISPGCTYVVSPASYTCADNTAKTYANISTVTTGQTCAWTATVDGNSTWLTTTSSGTGNGSVSITVTENTTSSQRVGTITVNGQTITVTQPGASSGSCTYSVSPASYTCADNKATSYANISAVTTGQTCAWTANVASGSWLSTTSSGTGNGNVSIVVQENTTTTSRVGTINVNGQIITVTQPGKASVGACSYNLSQSTFTCANGNSNSYPSIILVNATSSNCPWGATVTSGQTWLATNSNGVGSGTISIIVLQNNQTQSRTGTIDVNGQTLTIIQPGATCTYSLSTSNYSCSDATAKTYKGVTLVNALSGCSWTAIVNSGNSWLAGSSSGNGSGSVDITVLANTTGLSRTGTIKIEDQTLTITQQPTSYGIGINENQAKTLSVYPNPASSYLYIDNGSLNLLNGYSLRVVNTLGQTVYNQAVNKSQFYVDVTNWTGKGIYFMHILDNQNNIIDTRKIVVQ